MTTLELLICLLPIIFMIHDFEEIILFKYWISKNKTFLINRFPQLSSRLLARFEKLSTSGFTLAVAEEFVLLSLITYSSIYFKFYYLWLSIFMVFFIHLIIHLIQWIILRKYIPAILTTILILPYCIYTLKVVLDYKVFRMYEIALLSILGLVIIGLNLILAHKLAAIFDKWINVE